MKYWLVLVFTLIGLDSQASTILLIEFNGQQHQIIKAVRVDQLSNNSHSDASFSAGSIKIQWKGSSGVAFKQIVDPTITRAPLLNGSGHEAFVVLEQGAYVIKIDDDGVDFSSFELIGSSSKEKIKLSNDFRFIE